MDDLQVMPGRLEAFLAEAEPDATDIAVSGYEPIAGGYSRMMARFEVKWKRDGQTEIREFVLRGDPPADRESFHTDRRVEWELLSHLTSDGGVAVPAARYFCDGAHLGMPSIVMDFVPSTSLLSHVQGRDDLSAENARLAEVAATVHRTVPELMPACLERPSDYDSYLTGLIGRWSAMERAHPESDPFLRYVGAWLDAHRPPPVPLSLVHGDFQSANVIVTPADEWAVVDWEFAHIGDPREDLGYYRAVAGAAPPDVIGADEDAFCARYRERTGLSEDQINPLTLGYFTILGSVPVLAQIVEQKAALARGESHSIMGFYVVNAISFAHMVHMTVTEAIEAAMTQVEEGSC
jgi:aminoglycoside phosphotransferase (APT) family kinase protein